MNHACTRWKRSIGRWRGPRPSPIHAGAIFGLSKHQAGYRNSTLLDKRRFIARKIAHYTKLTRPTSHAAAAIDPRTLLAIQNSVINHSNMTAGKPSLLGRR